MNGAKTARKPFVLFGPPLSPERARAAREGQELRDLTRSGKLCFANPERDAYQLFCVARDGLYLWPPETPEAVASTTYVPAEDAPRPAMLLASRGKPARSSGPAVLPETRETPLPPAPDPQLMKMLCTLANHATTGKPLEILSLFRPPYRTAYWQHGGPGTMHSHAMAVDLAAYGGHKIAQDRPEECVQMALALLRDLPPGHYRFGLPKAPEAPAVVGEPRLAPELFALVHAVDTASVRGLPSRAGHPRQTPVSEIVPASSCVTLSAALGMALGASRKPWPFFPAQQLETKDGLIAPLQRNSKTVLDKKGIPQAHIVHFLNEDYAPAEAIADGRVRAALEKAQRRGVVIIGLFPDAADHIHVDVKPKR